ncbi:MAG TPA: hypothetical protein VN108_03325 [Marmoricola sp.]|nr:hypothetical protein [Marmoricola sp.]
MILLHGLGGAQDLPVSVPVAVTGGTIAVAATFIILALAWRSPRFEGPRMGSGTTGRITRVLDSPLWDHAMAILGLLFFGWCTWALLSGGNVNTNPVFGTFYVLVWVGVLPLSLLFGRVARALSPWRTLTRLRCRITGVSPDQGLLPYPSWLGYWPASLGLFAFVWQELVSTDQVSLPAVQLWLGIYALAMIAGSTVFGLTWLDHADPFQVYSDLLAKLSPWGRDDHGALLLRSPLSNLATLQPSPGLIATLAILFGSTIYDSAKDSVVWTNYAASLPIGPIAVGTLALMVSWAAVSVTFMIGASFNGPTAVPWRQLPGLLAPSLLPVIAGYMAAHYLSYFVLQGQITITQLSDPLSTGANYLGTSDISVNLWLMLHPTLLASLKVILIVIGHVVGAVSAHDRTLALVASAKQPPERRALPAGKAMGFLMLLYTFTGLTLLFGI